MRMKGLILQQLVIGTSIVLLLSTLSSAISVKHNDRKSKSKADDNVKFMDKDDEQSSSPVKQLERQGLYSDDDDQLGLDGTLDSRELVKRAQNVSEASPTGKQKKKEHNPPNIEEIPPADLRLAENNSDEEGERLAKADLNRESRGDKNPRIYYDDAAPRFQPPHHSPGVGGGESPSERKQKDGKLYFPQTFINSKYDQGPKKGHRPSLVGLSGKRIPDHIQFDEGGHPTHEYPTPAGHSHSHQHPVIGHHEHHEEHEVGPIDDEPYAHGHGIEEHHGKGPHHGHVTGGYGYHHHYGSYRHTIGDKVDAVGKALQVLIPSALLLTGVSALFPNRVHVPTTPNKYRQKRSVFRRRVSHRGMVPPPPLEPLPSAHIPPEFEDIPSHILRAEHRIMDGNPSEMYPDYGKRYGTASEENTGFDPFKVFKGPGPETTVNKMMQNAVPLPVFPPLPELTESNEKSNEFMQNFQRVNIPGPSGPPPNMYMPGPQLEAVQPTLSADKGIPQVTPNSDNIEKDNDFIKQRQNIAIRRRKPVRKPATFPKDSQKLSVQHSSESQKSQYLVNNIKNTIDDSKQSVQEKAEQEFMSSLQNLVTPDVAKAIVENKKDPPKEVDLSPDGPVMGLLTSYAQHENDPPACQKRALCELAVKGKNPRSTKFEAFLWSVATLVPDVFSEMYDLQEVFHAIRDERCVRFNCPNPNMDLQV